MKKTKLAAALVSAIWLAACGSSSDDSTAEPADITKHDETYVVSLFNTTGNCINDGSQAVLIVKNGVLDEGSRYGNSAISGMVRGDKLEAFTEYRNDTVTITGEFKSTVSGEWDADKGDCAGYFEEYSRGPIN